MHRSKKPSFDHFVGGGEQRSWNFQADVSVLLARSFATHLAGSAYLEAIRMQGCGIDLSQFYFVNFLAVWREFEV